MKLEHESFNCCQIEIPVHDAKSSFSKFTFLLSDRIYAIPTFAVSIFENQLPIDRVVEYRISLNNSTSNAVTIDK